MHYICQNICCKQRQHQSQIPPENCGLEALQARFFEGSEGQDEAGNDVEEVDAVLAFGGEHKGSVPVPGTGDGEVFGPVYVEEDDADAGPTTEAV